MLWGFFKKSKYHNNNRVKLTMQQSGQKSVLQFSTLDGDWYFSLAANKSNVA
jgi:hypothetical protein